MFTAKTSINKSGPTIAADNISKSEVPKVEPVAPAKPLKKRVMKGKKAATKPTPVDKITKIKDKKPLSTLMQ